MKLVDVPDLRRVPILPFTMAAASGVIAGLYIEIPLDQLAVICVVLFTLAAFFVWRQGVRTISIVLVSLFLVSFVAWRTTAMIDRDMRRQFTQWGKSDSTIALTGRVWLPASDAHDAASVVLDRVDFWPDSSRQSTGGLHVRVFADSATLSKLYYGDRIYARGELKPSISRTTARTGSLIAVLTQREGARLYSSSVDIVLGESGHFTLRQGVDDVRAWIRSTFNCRLSPDASALCRALLLGDRGDFSDDFSNKLRLTGLSHVFALSGVNVGIVVSVAWLFFGMLFLPRTLRLWMLLVIVLFYMELGRETPSLVRASLMAGFFVLGRLLHRQISVFNSVASAAFVELLWRPLDCLDAGFLLSYFSVLGLLSGFRFFSSLFQTLRSTRLTRVLESIWSLTAATFSAQIATLPLVGFLFHRIPLIGAAGNLVAVPLFGIMLLWALLLLFLQALCPIFAVPVALPLDGLAYLLGRFVDIVADLPLAGLPIPPLPLPMLLTIYAGVMLLFTGMFLRRMRWTIASAFFLANLIVWTGVLLPHNRDCYISFLYVGYGDATLISTPSGRNVLIDAGPTYGQWSAASRILPILADRQIRELDALILTHPDNDHIGGATSLLLHVPVKRIFTNGDTSDSRTYMTLRSAIARRNIKLENLYAGCRIRLERDVTLTVLSPDSALRTGDATENQNSLVIRLDYQGSSAMFPADVDSAVEYNLVAWSELLITDLLKIAHHGSKTATCESFLRCAKPEICIISCGPNIHGHPNPAVFKRLAARGLSAKVTQTEGIITFAARDGSWTRIVEPAQRLITQWKLDNGRI